MRTMFHAPARSGGKIQAFADVELGDGVIMKGFRIVDGENGLFAAVPSQSYASNGQTKYRNQVAFTNDERREQFLTDLLAAYGDWRREQV